MWGDAVSVLLMGPIYEVHRGDDLRWHGIKTKFHEDYFRHSGNITVVTRKCKRLYCTHDRDFLSKSLIQAHVARYTYQVS
jgi:hypothetical protein